MKFGNQSWPSSLIIHMVSEIADLDPEIKNLVRFGLKIAMFPIFMKFWHSEQIEHANYEYSI